jgi:hypothetical protein
LVLGSKSVAILSLLSDKNDYYYYYYFVVFKNLGLMVSINQAQFWVLLATGFPAGFGKASSSKK